MDEEREKKPGHPSCNPGPLREEHSTKKGQQVQRSARCLVIWKMTEYHGLMRVLLHLGHL